MSKSVDLNIKQNTQEGQATAAADDADTKPQEDKNDLPPILQKVHGAIWLVGLAFLFWRGDIFPGILVLVAISGIAQAVMQTYVSRQNKQQAVAVDPVRNLPDRCPNCGSPLNLDDAEWLNARTAKCPYCGSPVKAVAA